VSSREVVLGIDVGGTTVKGGVVGTDGSTVASGSLASPGAGGAALLASVRDLVADLEAEARAHGCTPVGAGVIVPGIVDESTGRVVYAANLSWEDLDLATELGSSTGLPVAVGHDVRGASLAERRVGGARGLADFVLVTLGTGISCAITTDGTTRVGASGAAGEIGHTTVYPGGETCSCGKRGCLEVYASAGGIARRYRAAGGEPGSSAATVSGRVGSEELAARIWQDATDALALALATLVLLVDPALVLLGGGLSRAGDALVVPTLARLGEELSWRAPPPMRVSPLGAGAGRIGAAILAMDALGKGDLVDRWQTGHTG
jgi:glucokinase